MRRKEIWQKDNISASKIVNSKGLHDGFKVVIGIGKRGQKKGSIVNWRKYFGEEKKKRKPKISKQTVSSMLSSHW